MSLTVFIAEDVLVESMTAVFEVLEFRRVKSSSGAARGGECLGSNNFCGFGIHPD
jgi:hypothetical protein